MRGSGAMWGMMAAVASAVLLLGCDSGSDGVSIEPSTATLMKGQSLEFEAVGGGPDYEWSLAEESLGTLSSRTGPVVTYTSTYRGTEAPVLQILTVVSLDDGDAADATITQVQNFSSIGSGASQGAIATTTTTTTTSTTINSSTTTITMPSLPTP